MRLLIDPVVAAFLHAFLVVALLTRREARDHAIHDGIDLRILLGWTRDDQRRPRFVDQDRVDLVHDGVVEVTLYTLFRLELHVVAQVVEAQLVVRGVGDVGGIGLAALSFALVVDDDAHRKPEEAMHLTHPLRVAPGQVVVDRHHVHSAAGQRIEIAREGRDQGLALARLHLGDASLVKHHPADDLHVVVALTEGALRSLAHGGEGFGKQIVEWLTVFDALPKDGRATAQPVVRQQDELALERVHPFHGGHDSLQDPIVVAPEDFL